MENLYKHYVNTVENIVVNCEIAHHEQFLLLPLCFQKSSAGVVVKCICKWEMAVVTGSFGHLETAHVQFVYIRENINHK